MNIHPDPHPLAGKTVTIHNTAPTPLAGAQYRVEDWWDRVAVESWATCDGNWAAMNYGIRAGLAGLPLDNEVVYGKINGFGHIVHVSEIAETNGGAS